MLSGEPADNKKANRSGLAFLLQINDLPEFDVERAMGIEPTALAWEARVLPLYDARSERLTPPFYAVRGRSGNAPEGLRSLGDLCYLLRPD